VDGLTSQTNFKEEQPIIFDNIQSYFVEHRLTYKGLTSIFIYIVLVFFYYNCLMFSVRIVLSLQGKIPKEHGFLTECSQMQGEV